MVLCLSIVILIFAVPIRGIKKTEQTPSVNKTPHRSELKPLKRTKKEKKKTAWAWAKEYSYIRLSLLLICVMLCIVVVYYYTVYYPKWQRYDKVNEFLSKIHVSAKNELFLYCGKWKQEKKKYEDLTTLNDPMGSEKVAKINYSFIFAKIENQNPIVSNWKEFKETFKLIDQYYFILKENPYGFNKQLDTSLNNAKEKLREKYEYFVGDNKFPGWKGYKTHLNNLGFLDKKYLT